MVARPWKSHCTRPICIPLPEGLVRIHCLHLSGLCREARLHVWISIGSLNLLETFSILRQFPGAGCFRLMAQQVLHQSHDYFHASCGNHRLISYRSVSLHRTPFLLSSPRPRFRPKPWRGVLFFSVSRSSIKSDASSVHHHSNKIRPGEENEGQGEKIWKRAPQIRDGCLSFGRWQMVQTKRSLGQWRPSAPVPGQREATQELLLLSTFRTKRKGWGHRTGVDWLYIKPFKPTRH